MALPAILGPLIAGVGAAFLSRGGVPTRSQTAQAAQSPQRQPGGDPFSDLFRFPRLVGEELRKLEQERAGSGMQAFDPLGMGFGGGGGGGGARAPVYSPPDADFTRNEVRALLTDLMGRRPSESELALAIQHFMSLHAKLINVPPEQFPSKAGQLAGAFEEQIAEQGVAGKGVQTEIVAKRLSDQMEVFRRLFGTG